MAGPGLDCMAAPLSAVSLRSWEPGFSQALSHILASRLHSHLQDYTTTVPTPSDKATKTCDSSQSVSGLTQLQHLDTLSLSLIAGQLRPKDIAHCKAVCKAWRGVASQPHIMRAAFEHFWGVEWANSAGQPRSWAAAESLNFFATRSVVHKTDTLACLAVRHGVSAHTLKRVNNMTSDHSLQSRTHIFIPVTSVEAVRGPGQLCRFCFDPVSCRDLALLVPKACASGSLEVLSQQEELEGYGHAEALTPAQVEDRAHKLAMLLSRSLRARGEDVDEETARFYLDEAEGNIKQALALAQQDTVWEAGPGRPPSPGRARGSQAGHRR